MAHVVGFGEDRVTELRSLLGKVNNDALRIVGIGAGAWGSIFIALLQDAYGALHDFVQGWKTHFALSCFCFILSMSVSVSICLFVYINAQRCSYYVQSLLCSNRE